MFNSDFQIARAHAPRGWIRHRSGLLLLLAIDPLQLQEQNSICIWELNTNSDMRVVVITPRQIVLFLVFLGNNCARQFCPNYVLFVFWSLNANSFVRVFRFIGRPNRTRTSPHFFAFWITSNIRELDRRSFNPERGATYSTG